MSDELPGVVGVNNYRFLHLKKSASFAFQKSCLSRCSTVDHILETNSSNKNEKCFSLIESVQFHRSNCSKKI